jgi:hypothetical protein
MQYMPTIGDMYTKDVEVNGAPRHIEIDDTAGQEAYADLKKEKMSTGDVSRAHWAAAFPWIAHCRGAFVPRRVTFLSTASQTTRHLPSWTT